MTSYNPHISLTAPFPQMELPTLFVWLEHARHSVADDNVPAELGEWVDWQRGREEAGLLTWAAYRDDELGGYLEAVRVDVPETYGIHPVTSCYAQVDCVFKKDGVRGLLYTPTALNLALYGLFKEGVDLAFFPVYRHNRPMQELYNAIGAGNIGLGQSRIQKEVPVDTVLWAIGETEWRRRNHEFIVAYEAQVVTDSNRVTEPLLQEGVA